MDDRAPPDRFDVAPCGTRWETGSSRVRIATITVFVLAITGAHWGTPSGEETLQVVHVVLRKLYILPVVLAAIWFGLSTALLTALAVTLLYLPHVILQWVGMPNENVNQVGEIVTIWFTAGLTGMFVGREKAGLRRLVRAHEESVHALVTALDSREHQTEQHSLRVRAYTLRLAAELGVAAEQQRVYALGALLHDVGKIGVPDAVLLKPAPLSREEWSQIQAHPEIGRKILSSVHFFHPALDIVYSHHERFDGSGYPDGLSGSAIPFGARLFAVADVFDALTSDRPYRSELTYEEARLEIETHSGTHFDPVVVSAFLKIPKAEWERIRGSIEDRPAWREN